MISEQIKQLKRKHPDWGYKRIADAIGCSKNLVKYHLKAGEKDKTSARVGRYRKVNVLCAKLSHFREIRQKKKNFDCVTADRRTKCQSKFTTIDLLTCFGENPICYLTGQPIDLDQPRTYEFDHIVSVCNGGDNSVENLGLSTRAANRAKGEMPLAVFVALCRLVVQRADSGVLDEFCHRDASFTGRNVSSTPRAP